jgi:hypothetical protein
VKRPTPLRAVLSLLVLACAVVGSSFEWGWPIGLLVAAALFALELVTP